MFLKRFPRYAGRARRGATVAGDHLRGTAVVVENAPKSLSRHDGTSVTLCANILETIRSLKLVSRAEEDHR